jgi:hypothetical protein
MESSIMNAPSHIADFAGPSDLDRRLLLGAAGIAGVVALSRLAHAGPINPPTGPVAATSKPLGELEPRTAINSTNTPGDAGAVFVITTNGSYVLSADVYAPAGKIGIKVTASNVSIDLNGFSVGGALGSGAGVSTPIGIGGATFNLRNGVILNMGGAGVFAEAQNMLVENVSVSDCAGMGFSLSGTSLRVANCGAFRNGSQGFGMTTASVVNCVAQSNGGIGFSAVAGTFENCLANLNSGGGFSASTLVAMNCVATQNGVAAFNSAALMHLVGCSAVGATSGFNAGVSANVTLVECSAQGAGGAGFSLLSAQTVHLQACTSRGCLGNGFTTPTGASLVACSAHGNSGHGFSIGAFCQVSNCTAVSNGTFGGSFSGFFVSGGCRVDGCMANANAQHGIATGSACTVTGCTAADNGSGGAGNAGFRSAGADTAFDSCTATGNPIGFSVTGGCIVTRNRASGNTTNFSATGTNFVGASITAAANVATANGWANFEF